MRPSLVLTLLASLFGLQCFCAAMTCPNVGCSFTNNLCGWPSSNDGVSLNPPSWQTAPSYARLDVFNKQPGVSAVLTSPLLDSQAGHSCQLTFRYYLGGSGTSGCQLTVYQTTDSGARSMLWSTRQATGTSLGSSGFLSHSVSVNCQSGTGYQIIIKGEVVVTNYCGFDNLIAVDDITCTATPPPTTSTTTTTTTSTTTPTTTTTKTTTGTTTTTTPTTTTTAGETTKRTCDNCSTELSSSTSPGVQHTGIHKATGLQESTGAIGPGPIAGIVIAGVAVVAVGVVIIVVVVKRRRSEGKRERLPAEHVYENREFAPDLATRDGSGAPDHHNNDLHGSGYPSNDNEGPARANYQNVEDPGVAGGAAFDDQTNQNASNNIYEPLAHEDVGLSNPYNVLTNESAPNTYEAFSSRADSHVYKTLTNQKRDADGYEWPVARAKPRP